MDRQPDSQRTTADPSVHGSSNGLPEIGDEVDDFLLIDELGEGAFAKVFLAHQVSLRRTVALKVSVASSEEAQTLAQLDHPNIVRVYDEKQVAGRDLHLLYMEYVPAGTLEPVIERVRETPPAERSGQLLLDVVDESLGRRGEDPPLDSMLRDRLKDASWPDAVAILGSHLAAALDYAHANSVLHRDVKPANVLLDASGRAKLADFNISWSAKVGGSARDYMGGSLPYMSPEQLAAASPVHPDLPEDLDGRSDVYGLGVVLWELLTGDLPLPKPEGQDWIAIFNELVDSRRTGVPQAAIDALPEGVPPMLRDVLLDCLAPDPEQRPATGAQLGRRLELCLHERARELLTPPQSRFQRFLVRRPLLGLLLVALVPNVALAYLNVTYNFMTVVERSDWDGFWHQVNIVNGIGFPLGIGILTWVMWPVIRAVRSAASGAPPTDEERGPLRRRALRMGFTASAVVLPLWVAGGLAFPIWQHVSKGEPHAGGYFHFTLSNGFFGVLAATACFFFINFLTARLLYPRLIVAGDKDEAAVAQMRRLDRRLTWYFVACTVVPLASVLVLTMPFVPVGTMRPVFSVLSVMGLAAFGVTYWITGQIRRDLDALQVALAPRPGRWGAGF